MLRRRASDDRVVSVEVVSGEVVGGEVAVGDGPAPTRVERRRGRRIQQILTAAAELFGERGYDAVSLEDVADRLDLTKGSLYYYFPSKDALGSAAIEALGDEWTSRLERLPAARGGTPAERLRALIHGHVTVAVRDYPAALRVFLSPNDWPEPQRASIKALRRRHDELFRTVVDEGVATGDFTVIDVDTVLQCMHAAMTQAPAWCGELRGAARDRAIDDLTDTLLLLVGVRPTAPPLTDPPTDPSPT